MPNTPIPSTRGEMLDLIEELQAKLAKETDRIKTKDPGSALPEGSELEVVTYTAAIDAPAPSEQWEC